MIFAGRLHISGLITLGADMHIGDGDPIDVGDRKVARTACDHIGAPIIPASSLKGALAAALREYDEDLVKRLFGEGSDHKSGLGRAAQLWLDHATLKSSAEGLERLGAGPVENGVFRATHVALDPKYGAAMDHKLFTREVVGAGATFEFRADWFGSDETDLAPLFALLRDGVQLGRGATKGRGRVSLDPCTLKLTRYDAQDDGSLGERSHDATGLYEEITSRRTHPKAARRITLRLTAEGPYLSAREKGGGANSNEISPLERGDKPVLWPESLIGALRNRARWLAAVAADDGGAIDDPDRPRTSQELRDKAGLTAVEALFGVTGRKGDIIIRSIDCNTPGDRVAIASNSIDRFTGATRDGALFTRRAFWAPVFEVEINVTGDHPILDALLCDIGETGLELGHGASVGFGWFRVEVTDDRR